MVKTLSIVLLCGTALIVHSYGQEVFSGDQKAKPKYPKAQVTAADQAKKENHLGKAVAVQPEKTDPAPKQSSASKPAVVQNAKHGPATIPPAKVSIPAAAVPPPSKSQGALAQTTKPADAQNHSGPVAKTASAVTPLPKTVATAKAPNVEMVTTKSAVILPPAEGSKHEVAARSGKKAPLIQTKPVASAPRATSMTIQSTKASDLEESEAAPPSPKLPKSAAVTPIAKKSAVMLAKPPAAIRPVTVPAASVAARKESPSWPMQKLVADPAPIAQPVSTNFDTAFTRLADGFDFPVGKPDAQGYYKARGFRSHGHLGEDWDGVRGGDTDLGDPIYSIGDGLVVFARDCHMGWGNVVIVRHSYREGGSVRTVDALYGHLQNMLVRHGQAITRGQKIATMGTAHGLYDAHLHLEIRKNIEIGMSRAAFARDFSNYYDPTQFIETHRHLKAGGGTYRVAMNTFTRDANIKWDKVRNYSHAHTGGGSRESAAALKRAVAAQH